MFSGSTLDVASRAVGIIIESKTCLVLFYPFYEGTTGLANIELVAIPTGNFVYDILTLHTGVADLVCDRSDLRLVLEWNDVVMSYRAKDFFKEDAEDLNYGIEATRLLSVRLWDLLLLVLARSMVVCISWRIFLERVSIGTLTLTVSWLREVVGS